MENGVRKFTDALHTEYTVRGTEEYIDATVAEIVRDYPPAGYDTRVKARGVGWAQVVRDNSCD